MLTRKLTALSEVESLNRIQLLLEEFKETAKDLKKCKQREEEFQNIKVFAETEGKNRRDYQECDRFLQRNY